MTLQKFLHTCRENRYVVEEVNFSIKAADTQEGPFYPDTVPIQLYMITSHNIR